VVLKQSVCSMSGDSIESDGWTRCHGWFCRCLLGRRCWGNGYCWHYEGDYPALTVGALLGSEVTALR